MKRSPLPNQRRFESPSDVLRADVADIYRLNGYWNTPGDALDRIFSILRSGSAVYGIYDVPDFDAAPPRDDFPGWRHVGGHEAVGRRLWNWFHWRMPLYRVSFSDSPDFQAITNIEGGHTHFIWGDIGRVSASTFVYTLLQMRAGDLWMSIKNEGRTHVIIMFLGPLLRKRKGRTKRSRSRYRTKQLRP